MPPGQVTQPLSLASLAAPREGVQPSAWLLGPQQGPCNPMRKGVLLSSPVLQTGTLRHSGAEPHAEAGTPSRGRHTQSGSPALVTVPSSATTLCGRMLVRWGVWLRGFKSHLYRIGIHELFCLSGPHFLHLYIVVTAPSGL